MAAQTIIVFITSESKVNQSNIHLLIYHDILCLDISVHYSLSMHILDCVKNLTQKIFSNNFAKSFMFIDCVDKIKHIETFDVLHYDVRDVLLYGALSI